jgi:hypothetical protein
MGEWMRADLYPRPYVLDIDGSTVALVYAFPTDRGTHKWEVVTDEEGLRTVLASGEAPTVGFAQADAERAGRGW